MDKAVTAVVVYDLHSTFTLRLSEITHVVYGYPTYFLNLQKGKVLPIQISVYKHQVHMYMPDTVPQIVLGEAGYPHFSTYWINQGLSGHAYISPSVMAEDLFIDPYSRKRVLTSAYRMTNGALNTRMAQIEVERAVRGYEAFD